MPRLLPSYCYDTHEIRRFEQAAIQQSPPGALMHAAGQACAARAHALLSAASSHADPSHTDAAIWVLVGPGDNGGDASLAALELHAMGYQLVLIAPWHEGRETIPGSDPARAAWQACQNAKLTQMSIKTLLAQPWSSCCMVIDGLFGIGLSRPLPKLDSSDTTSAGQTDPFSTLIASLVAHINHRPPNVPVLAIDVPSGLNPDTGAPFPESACIRADFTVTMLLDKPGLHTGEGLDLAGEVEVAKLGVGPTGLVGSGEQEIATIPTPRYLRLDDSCIASWFAPKPRRAHKGTGGDVVCIGGAPGMIGALRLCSRAALSIGAGRVFAQALQVLSPTEISPATPVTDTDLLYPEILGLLPGQAWPNKTRVIAIGPGLGGSASAHLRLQSAMELCAGNAEIGLVLDADALNLLAQNPDLLAKLTTSRLPRCVLTPHPLEALRLLQALATNPAHHAQIVAQLGPQTLSVQHLESQRFAVATLLAQGLNATVVLKGPGTIIQSAPSEAGTPPTAINTSGNPGLATGGSGDVLTGMIAALLTHPVTSWQAACAAVWLHGHAADILVAQGHGPYGLSVSDLANQARRAFNQRLV